MLRALLFDLDGTLIDTAPEIALALNRTLAWLGRAEADPDTVRGWIGDGARALLDKALGEPSTDAVWEHFSYEYNAACGEASTLYPGVRAMLERLHAQGLKLAVLTNKEARFAHKLLALHDITAHFDLLVAGDSLAVKKPHPGVVSHALAALDVQADETAFVGDSITDVRTARAAGVRAWIVSHGYPNGSFTDGDTPDAFVGRFADFDPLGGDHAPAPPLTAIH
jgi:phosphoglycolate phosphatase